MSRRGPGSVVRTGPLVGVLLGALVASGCTAPVSSSGRGRVSRPAATTSAVTGSAAAGSAAAALAGLRVKGRAPMTGYDRDRFGQAWLDADRNGCDTRDDVLARDLTRRAVEPGTHDCVVTSGVLADPYTGTSIDFVRGDGDLVDIDHVVALGDAWATGASRWSIGERAALANDPMNLLAVDSSANRQKGDGDAATWLPPARAVRCAYVARQVAVKAKYGLWVTAVEGAAVGRVLSRCPGEPLPPDSGAPLVVDQHLTDPGTGTGPTGSTGAGEYASCDEARAAGAAPLHRGEPGYAAGLDGDGDGVACE